MSKPELWPHQQAAKDFVDGKSAAMLAMVMRSGKSRVTVELLDERKAMNTLLVCPKSVVDVWPEQFEQYSDRNVICCTLKKGTLKQRMEQAKAFGERFPNQPKVFIINMDAFWRKPFLDWAMNYHWDAFVADEAHRLKAPGGVASRAAARLTLGGGADRRKIAFRLALTGTPMPHDPLDLYGQYRFLDQAVFGTSYTFVKNRYSIQVPANGFQITVGYNVAPGTKYFRQDMYDEFQEKFHRLAYVVGPEVLNLPEPLHITRYCELEPKGRKIYDDLEKNFYAEVEAGEITASNAMVKALRLQQCTSGFARLADSSGDDELEVDRAKRSLLEDTLADLDEPVVVFCRFRHDLDSAHEAARMVGMRSLELSGRINQLQEWQQGGAPVLAVQTQAGGVGIDLSRAKLAIYYSLGLSLGDHLQSLARLQAKDMAWHPTYYYLLAKGTVDEKVYCALEARKEIIEEIMKR